MQNILIVFTSHSEIRVCNSKELIHIKRTNPDLVFEEFKQPMYEKIYLHNNQTTLESNAIKEYLKTNQIDHISVDTFALPPKFL